jgi:hypothetical protein
MTLALVCLDDRLGAAAERKGSRCSEGLRAAELGDALF